MAMEKASNGAAKAGKKILQVLPTLMGLQMLAGLGC